MFNTELPVFFYTAPTRFSEDILCTEICRQHRLLPTQQSTLGNRQKPRPSRHLESGPLATDLCTPFPHWSYTNRTLLRIPRIGTEKRGVEFILAAFTDHHAVVL